MDLLNEFQNDEFTRDAVKTFMLERLDKIALERVYLKQDTTAIATAREVILTSFQELSEKYDKTKIVETTNTAR